MVPAQRAVSNSHSTLDSDSDQENTIMSTEITYIGSFDAVDIELAPNLWETVTRGGTIKVADRLAESLLAQTDNWTPVKPAKTTKSEPTTKKRKEG